MNVDACVKKEKRSEDYDCLPRLRRTGQPVERARISDRIGVILGMGSVFSIALICAFVYCGVVIGRGGIRTSSLVLPVVCLSLAVIAATIFACRVFLNLVSGVQRALNCRKAQAEKISEEKRADSYYRRTSTEYEKDVMDEVDRLTDAVIGDFVHRDYTADGYIRDVRKEANRTVNVVLDEMQFCNAELDEARNRERAITRYRKDVMEDAAKIVDAVIRSMGLEKECRLAIYRERRSAAYVEDVKSSADKIVDNAITRTKVVYAYYDDRSGCTCARSIAETRVIVNDFLKHVKVDGAQKYVRNDTGRQK